MKFETREATTRVEGESQHLGTYQVPIFETVQDALDKFNGKEDVVVGLLNSAYGSDLGRVARTAFQKDGATEDSVQKAVDSFVPGQRSIRPTQANLLKITSQLAVEGKEDAVKQTLVLMGEEGIEAAFNYAMGEVD